MITVTDAINGLAGDVYSLKQQRDRQNTQRRVSVSSQYGIPYFGQGSADVPVKFYLPVIPRLISWLQFEFQVIIQPFLTTVSSGDGMTPASADIEIRNEDVNMTINGSANAIAPNPHTHSVVMIQQPHTHQVIRGMSMSGSAIDNFRMDIDGVDITNKFRGLRWVDGEGIFPDKAHTYKLPDVLESISEWQRAQLFSTGTKEITIANNGLFNVCILWYLKYNHYNA